MTEQLQSHPEQAGMAPEYQQALGGISLQNAMKAPHFFVKYPEYYPGVEAMADYKGSWTVAQVERMAQPFFEDRLTTFVDEGTATLKDGEPGPFDKPASYKSHFTGIVESFEENGDRAYEAFDYGPAASFGNQPHEVGRGGIGRRPAVFSDAEMKEGQPLNDRQKDIIAAHEAYHGMVKTPDPARKQVLEGFDLDAYYDDIVPSDGIRRVTYMTNPDELMARMAQLKNYYGMRSSEPFTKEHLDYARAHYVADTGLDNSMSVMFRMISPKTEPDFLRLMNTLPV